MAGSFDSLDNLLRQRHSCRGFRPGPVPEPMVERIVATAGRVPSWCNAQPWQVIVTRKAETDRLREVFPAEAQTAEAAPDLPFPDAYTGVYRQRRSDCGWALYDAVGVARGDWAGSAAQSLENFRFFGAPHIALVTTDRDLGPYGALDCGAFVTAFTLAAAALGVASIPQAAVAAFAPFLRRWFELPDSRRVLCAISFGYENPNHAANGFRTDRAALGEILTWR